MGGNNNGRFTQARLDSLKSKLSAGDFKAYEGLALDVEECDSGLASSFTDVLATAKSVGMETMVTISHSAPYGCDDASTLMQAFFADRNTDYLSPQMYTSGEEPTPDFDEAAGATFAQFAQARAAIIPSIVDGTHYQPVVQFFSGKGIQLSLCAMGTCTHNIGVNHKAFFLRNDFIVKFLESLAGLVKIDNGN